VPSFNDNSNKIDKSVELIKIALNTSKDNIFSLICDKNYAEATTFLMNNL
jgi:hypothetical protein